MKAKEEEPDGAPGEAAGPMMVRARGSNYSSEEIFLKVNDDEIQPVVLKNVGTGIGAGGPYGKRPPPVLDSPIW